MRIGIVGYGLGGQKYHAPYIEAAKGLELGGVVARSPEKVASVHADFPGVPVFKSLTEMIAANVVDAVTITTPPETRRALVLEAIDAGLHVVADKPFAPTADAAKALDKAAKEAGVVVAVYHNRRNDSDILTLKKVLDEGALGTLWSLYSRFEIDDPDSLELGPQGGLLRDLGSHLVDQALWLLGPVKSVTAYWTILDSSEGPTDEGFQLNLVHQNGVHSHLSANKHSCETTRELRAYGRQGSFKFSGIDVQTQAIHQGLRPADAPEAWGFVAPEHWPILRTRTRLERVSAEQGSYHAFYEDFVSAVETGSKPPVTALEAADTLAVLDAARISAEEGKTVYL